MHALFEQFPMLLPALGIGAVVVMFLVSWLLTSDLLDQPSRPDRRTRSDLDVWPGAPYDGAPYDGGSGAGGADCGSDGGACGGD
jgi:hypothetical protein